MTDEEALRDIQDRLSTVFDVKRLVLEGKRQSRDRKSIYSVWAIAETDLPSTERLGVAMLAMRGAEVEADIAVVTPLEATEASPRSLLARAMQEEAERRRTIIDSARGPNRFLDAVPVSQGRRGQVYEAFGQTLTSAEWSEDDRCAVSIDTLRGRLGRGWPVQAALLLPNLGNGDYLDAFGKGQPIQDWLADPCCVVPASILLARLAAGEALESALIRPEPGHLPEVWPRFADRPRRDEKKRKYEAFGEARTLTQWAKDPRCVVPLAILRDRIYGGIATEAALIFEEYGLMRRYWAFGERMVLSEWLCDPRFVHVGVEFKTRLDSGALLEEALGVAPVINPSLVRQGRYSFLEIDGERKLVADWVKDPRCEVSGNRLRDRIKEGWPPTLEILLYKPNNRESIAHRYEARMTDETVVGRYPNATLAHAALTGKAVDGQVFDRSRRVVVNAPAKVQRIQRCPERLTAFGVTKTLDEWASDLRCRVTAQHLVWRLAHGWPIEAALIVGMDWKRRYLTAFREDRKIQGWLADPRCAVPASVLLDRLAQGEPFRSALTRPEPGRPPEVWDNAAHDAAQRRRGSVPRRGVDSGEPSARMYEAFGESKSAAEWQWDTRCAVSADTFIKRLKRDWPCERALSTPLEFSYGRPDELRTALGEAKTVPEWSRDPRCQVQLSQFLRRLSDGWPIEAAVVVAKKWSVPMSAAFGEKKRLHDWLADPRCAVPAAVLIERLEQGEPLESALTRPEPGWPPEVWIKRAEPSTAR